MRASDTVRLFVIVPVYGQWDEVMHCLSILSRQSIGGFQVLVADDGSPEPPPAEVREFPRTTYCRHDNVGFAGNCNRAAAMALEQGATHLLFLNGDTHFSTGFMEAWLRVLSEDPHSILTPVIYWHGRPECIWYSGGAMSVLVPFFRLRRDVERHTQVDVVSGCALCVPSEAWLALGGFDTRYVTYFEDFDLCCRARRAGIGIAVAAGRELRVWHRVPGSFRHRGRWQRHYRFLESQLLFIHNHYSGLRLALCRALVVCHLLAAFVYYLPQLPSLGRLAKVARNTNGIV